MKKGYSLTAYQRQKKNIGNYLAFDLSLRSEGKILILMMIIIMIVIIMMMMIIVMMMMMMMMMITTTTTTTIIIIIINLIYIVQFDAARPYCVSNCEQAQVCTYLAYDDLLGKDGVWAFSLPVPGQDTDE